MKKSIRILSGIGLTLFLAAAVQTFRSGEELIYSR